MIVNKIVIFSPDLGYGGAQRVSITLANYLVEMYSDVEIVTLTRSRNELSRLINNKVRVSYLNVKMRHALFYWLYFFFSNRSEGALVISTIRYANVVVGFAKLLSFSRKKNYLVFREANTYRQEDNNTMSFKFRNYIISKTYKVSDMIIANSNDTKLDIEKYLKQVEKTKIFVKNNPISFEKEQFDGSAVVDMLEKNLSGKFIVGSVGRFVEQKDFEFLITSFYHFKRMVPNTSLIIVGEGPKKFNYVQLIQSLNLRLDVDVFLVEPLVNIPLVIGLFDLFCLTSKWEGFGNVVIESALCNVPVLIKSCPGAAPGLVNKNKIGIVYDGVNEQEFGELMATVPPINETFFKNRYVENYAVSSYFNLIKNKLSELAE